MKKQRGPWTILKSRKVYKNPWINVQEDKVLRPDGKKGIYATVNIKSGVNVLPIDNNDNVYLIREFLYPRNKYSLEVLGGGINDNETILDAAKRELQEESGIVAKQWVYLGYEKPLTSYTNMANHIYLARDISFTKNKLDGTETIDIKKLSLKKAYKMVLNNKIAHSGSQIALLKTMQYLSSQSS